MYTVCSDTADPLWSIRAYIQLPLLNADTQHVTEAHHFVRRQYVIT